MNRLTDSCTADQVRQNCSKLLEAGVEPSILDLMYVRLAEYENEEERRERTSVNYDPGDYYE